MTFSEEYLKAFTETSKWMVIVGLHKVSAAFEDEHQLQ